MNRAIIKTKTLLNVSIGLGSVLTVVSAVWWGVVYHFVSQGNGESMWASINCLYSVSESCNFYRAMGWLQGVSPNEPVLFWMGLTILLMSVLIKSSLVKELNQSEGAHA